jgi:OmpA-OmpF porin, OOP family
MSGIRNPVFVAAAFAGGAFPAFAAAQTTVDELLALDKGSLRGEVQMRYDAALGLTVDPGVLSADDSRFTWASQAKAQCGIALGFLKSGTKDPVSIGKCVDAYNRMQLVPRSPLQPPPPHPMTVPMAACNHGPYIVFFEWDSAEISPEAATVLDSSAAAYANCSQARLELAGYTDSSGGDRYNHELSIKRADAVRDYLSARGVPVSAMSTQGFGEANPRVPTADGVHELQNRRVEITVQ